MKICWDNLSKMIYKGNGLWINHKRDYYTEAEACEWCKESYLYIKYNPTKFCSHKCCGTSKLMGYWNSVVPSDFTLRRRKAKLLRETNQVDDLPDAKMTKPKAVIKVSNPNRRGRPSGHRMSQESKDKIAKSMSGRKRDNESRLQTMLTNRGKTKSQTFTNRGKHDGTYFINKDGYKSIYVGNGTYIREHRWIAEKVLGRPLKATEIVHHIDGDKRNNSHNNLIICEAWLHVRLHRALKKWTNKSRKIG